MDSALKSYLDKNHISYIIHEHPAVFTVEESKSVPSIQKIPGVRSKNLFLKDDIGRFYLVCLPGEKRLNIKNLEAYLRVKKLKFGSSQELKSELNLTPGSVSIFGMIYSKNVILLVDREIWDAQIVSFHPNINTATLELNHLSFLRFYESLRCKKEVVDLA